MRRFSSILLLITVFLLHGNLAGQALSIEQRLNGNNMLKVFQPVREQVQSSSAVIYSGRKKLVYGTVVSENGYILTKASEIEGEDVLDVRIGKKKYSNVPIVSVQKNWDVALMKVEGDSFPTLNARESSELSMGSWVISNGSTTRKQRRIRIGVYSARPREISGIIVAIGMSYTATEKGLKITAIGKGGAEEAGVNVGDVVTEIAGQKTGTGEDLQNLLMKKLPGDVLTFKIERDGTELELDVELKKRFDVFDEQKTRNDAMSGRYSKRRTNFPRILQHDIPLSNESVGGPVFTLEGECIGMNIAVANRCESYAIPIEELQQLAKEMIAEAESE